ncbi:prepilin-type N-terminal cleavage/methylation domain-containing protein [Neptunomonas sp. XY-337]|uniref:pilus assembly FimT family protein n=1 Tax=Neptunomonas sp. XY-337 TaxID=2561897 RepID=UPI0010AB03AD|nr:prepilin-type N-terminal cleavage/methylation domain-containing protein [Neptunomonas sp. XY-337]
MFSKAKTADLLKKFAKVDINDIQDANLRAKAKGLKAKQGGFTLLELLVVVAILAAIAGTATIALQDTDARASAAAHVAMMDELNKGIRTFRVLNKNTLPSGFDSMIQDATGDFGATGGQYITVGAASEALSILDLPVGAAEIMNAGGIESLQYINTTLTPADSPVDCSNLEDVIASRANAVVAGNIFLAPAANGCGYTWNNVDSDDILDGYQLNGAPKVAVWTGGYERVMGEAGQGFDAAGYADDDRPALMAVGLGPSSNLFNANDLGGMTSVPVYRHVSETEYNRFIALFNIGTLNAAGDAITAGDQVTLTAIVDGAGDTKEEELGEWDGTRNTI